MKTKSNALNKFYISNTTTILIIIISIVVLTSVYYFVSEITILYTLHKLSQTLLNVHFNLCVLLPITFVVAFIALKPKIPPIYEIFIWVCIGITLCISCSMSTLTGLQAYRHNGSLYTASYAYHVDSWWAVGVGGDSDAIYRIWQCDRFDLICRKVATYRAGGISPYFYEKFSETQVRINHHIEKNLIEFRLDNIIIYSQKP